MQYVRHIFMHLAVLPKYCRLLLILHSALSPLVWLAVQESTANQKRTTEQQQLDISWCITARLFVQQIYIKSR